MSSEVCVDPNRGVTVGLNGGAVEEPGGGAAELPSGEVRWRSDGAAAEVPPGDVAEGPPGRAAKAPDGDVTADQDADVPACDGVDVRIVRGTPDETELAALLAVLTMVAGHRGTARAGGRSHLSCRAHWDRAWGGGLHPCGSWRVRDRTVTAFDPGSR
ncbi:acyl-CoA carboxylase subunit epsilon [Streptomyces sp. SCSIO 30461]|uniref:acyl-CoA carboxylase subunit epsilon n=1 Tax=Streptomyces sp. SCSIO 30461 TaxID=3118085 RepID=UPI0030D1801D